MRSFSLSHSTFRRVYRSFSRPPALLILFVIFQTHSHFCLFLQADYYNCKLPKFFSRYLNPGCAGVGFFVQSHEGVNYLVVPHLCLIVRAVNNFCLHKAVATVVVPFQISSYICPILSRKFFNFIIGYNLFIGRYILLTWQKNKLLIGSEIKVPWTYFGHQNGFQVVQITIVHSPVFVFLRRRWSLLLLYSVILVSTWFYDQTFWCCICWS